MLKLGVRCVRRAVSGAGLTDFGKAAYVSLLLVLLCALSPAFAQASAGCTHAEGSGSNDDPYEVRTLCELQGISSNPTKHYVLVDNIDASETKVWNGGAGFRPIASTATDGFSGSFVNPDNYVISSLTINSSSTTNVGLFSRLANGATIQGVILVGSRTTGRDSVGSLVGFNQGVIDNNSATGSVFGQSNVGGLVGYSSGRSTIDNSFATGSVSGDDFVGGLVGFSSGDISNSFATGPVFGSDDDVGGLVGKSEGNISDSSATGSVSGAWRVGGLVGRNSGSINSSHAVGSVSGLTRIGGLVGQGDVASKISRSYATGSFSGQYVRGGFGGLVGRGDGDISDSYATGSVVNARQIGGLVGYQGSSSRITNSYATGQVGGLVSRLDGLGGLVGNSYGSISDSYYGDLGNSLGERGVGANGSGLIFGIKHSFTQLRCPTTASEICLLNSQESTSTYVGWDTDVWDFGTTADLPQLLGNRNPDLNRKPRIKGSAVLVVRAASTGITRFPLQADYPGRPGEPATVTWSLSFDASSVQSGLAYFDRGDGTTSTEFIDRKKSRPGVSEVTLVVADGEGLTDGDFYVEFRNSIFDNVEQLLVLNDAQTQTRTILEASTRTILSFGATDQDNPGSGGSGLSWGFFSTERIAEGTAVKFSGTTRGGTVDVEVTRTLGLYDVSSFVLEVTNSSGVKTMVTVTIEAVCSTVPGVDLMAGQTGAGTPGNPYQIKSLCQLQDVSSSPSAYYELAANIDASKTRDWNDDAGFEPIASGEGNGFSGSFVNATNYEIRSLTISRSDTDNVGLFSRLARGAVIRGIILVGSRTTGRSSVGSLVGSNAGVIEGCSATGSAVFGRIQVGGLVGRNEWGAGIRRSYADSTVTGTASRIGGLVGFSVRLVDIVSSYYTGQKNGLGEQRTYEQLACPTAPDAMCLLQAGLVTYAGWSSRVWDFGSADDLPQLLSAIGDFPALRVRVYLGGAVR